MNTITNGPMATGVQPTTISAEQTQQQAETFDKLLRSGSPSGNPRELSPQEMLIRQIDMVWLTVSIDLGAKLAGSVSQSINKLVSMA